MKYKLKIKFNINYIMIIIKLIIMNKILMVKVLVVVFLVVVKMDKNSNKKLKFMQINKNYNKL